MQKIFAIVLFMLVFELTVSAQSTEQTIRGLHDSYCRAVEKKDSVFLKDLFHDNMVITSGNGTKRDKRGEIKDSLDPRYAVNYFRSRNVEVRTYDGTAVVTGELYWEMVFDGKTATNERVFTFTYAKVGNQWKIVAQHMGRVPPK